MKIDIWYSSCCSCCGYESEVYRKEKDDTVKKLQKELRNCGWKFIKGENVCKECFENKLYLSDSPFMSKDINN